MDWWTSTFPKGRQTLTIEDAGGQPVAIAYGEVGEGPTLVLLHGIGVWSYAWRENVAALAQHYRVVCFDAVGAGFSEKPMRPSQPGHQVLEAARVVGALCGGPVIWVGQSLGALTILGVAIDHPHLVDRMVVINVPVFPKKLPSTTMQTLATIPQPLVYAADRLQLLKRMRPVARWMARSAKRESLAKHEVLQTQTAYVAAYPYVEQFGALTCFARDLKLAMGDIEGYLQNQPCYTRRLEDNLGAIAQPTLVLWGEEDSWFPVENGKALHQRLPNAKLHVMPGCGHKASETCPRQVNEAVLEFLRHRASR
ncbi:MAG: alpha/beta fold hydrolase [Elainellaceae cyanobacterium]